MDADKSEAAIFGVSIGDALDYPTEFMSLSQIKDRYIPILLPVSQAASVAHGLGSTLSLKTGSKESKNLITSVTYPFGYLKRNRAYE